MFAIRAKERIKNGEVPRNALKYSDLMVGRTVYHLSVGVVLGPRTITGLTERYIKFDNYEHSSYLSDCGVWDAPKPDYINYLNALFATADDAGEYLNSLEYGLVLQEHRALCGSMLSPGGFSI